MPLSIWNLQLNQSIAVYISHRNYILVYFKLNILIQDKVIVSLLWNFRFVTTWLKTPIVDIVWATIRIYLTNFVLGGFWTVSESLVRLQIQITFRLSGFITHTIHCTSNDITLHISSSLCFYCIVVHLLVINHEFKTHWKVTYPRVTRTAKWTIKTRVQLLKASEMVKNKDNKSSGKRQDIIWYIL